MQTFIASIFVFGLLIFFHELGHFIVARMMGIRVHEFSLGFGPKVAGVLAGGTAYNLRAFPLGGFVRMAGVDLNEEEPEKDRSKWFISKTVGQRAAVIFAGPLMNFILAVILLAAVFVFQGLPVPSESTVVGKVVPGLPAERSGIAAGDRIVAVDGRQVENWSELVKYIYERPDKTIEIKVLRNEEELCFEVKTVKDDQGLGKIGIYQATSYKKVGLLPSLYMSFEWTAKMTLTVLDFLSKMVFGQAPADLGGPVRVVSEIGRAARVGLFFLLELAAFLSINLGLFNLLPIPALDGSRLLFLGWEKLKGRPVDPAKENFIHLVGFGLLLLLMVVITYRDIVNIFGNQQLK